MVLYYTRWVLLFARFLSLTPLFSPAALSHTVNCVCAVHRGRKDMHDDQQEVLLSWRASVHVNNLYQNMFPHFVKDNSRLRACE